MLSEEIVHLRKGSRGRKGSGKQCHLSVTTLEWWLSLHLSPYGFLSTKVFREKYSEFLTAYINIDTIEYKMSTPRPLRICQENNIIAYYDPNFRQILYIMRGKNVLLSDDPFPVTQMTASEVNLASMFLCPEAPVLSVLGHGNYYKA